MWQTLVITDLTQMKEADRVCVAGINEDAQCIRPVDEIRERGIPKDLLCEQSLFHDNGPIIYPRARVKLDLSHLPVQLPHIEDGALWRPCFSPVKRQGRDRQKFLDEPGSSLKGTQRQYLRIDLARPWKHEESN